MVMGTADGDTGAMDTAAAAATADMATADTVAITAVTTRAITGAGSMPDPTSAGRMGTAHITVRLISRDQPTCRPTLAILRGRRIRRPIRPRRCMLHPPARRTRQQTPAGKF